MVHVQYRSGTLRDALRGVERLEKGGVDGLLFENWGTLHFGINVLPLEYETAFDMARKTDASFVQVDTFVDRVLIEYEPPFVIGASP